MSRSASATIAYGFKIYDLEDDDKPIELENMAKRYHMSFEEILDDIISYANGLTIERDGTDDYNNILIVVQKSVISTFWNAVDIPINTFNEFNYTEANSFLNNFIKKHNLTKKYTFSWLLIPRYF